MPGDTPRARLLDNPSSCSGLQVAHGSLDPQNIADVYSIGATATKDAFAAWKSNHITASGGSSGLCQIYVSVANYNLNGFDVVFTLTDPGIPVSVVLPNTQSTVSFTATVHVAFPNCFDSSWSASIVEPPAYLPVGDYGGSIWQPWTARGTAYFSITALHSSLPGGQSFEGSPTKAEVEIHLTYSSVQTKVIEVPPTTKGDPGFTTEASKPITLAYDVHATGTPFASVNARAGSISADLNGSYHGVTIGGLGDALVFNGPGLVSFTGTYKCGVQPWSMTLESETFGPLNFKYSVGARTLPTIVGMPEISESASWRTALLPPTPQPSPSPTPAPTTRTTGPVGATLQAKDGSTVQVLNFGPATYSSVGLVTPTPNTTLEAIQVGGCASPKPLGLNQINPLAFTLQTTDGTSIQPTLGAVDKQIPAGLLTPGACTGGSVAFVVPNSKKVTKVIFQVDQITGESLTWSVP